MKLRIATCTTLPEPDPDQPVLDEALAARGVAARLAPWDDPAEPWDDPIPTVIRSTWNYIHARDAFLAWAERAARAAPLWNPLDIVRWSSHKHYLADLAARGVPVVPTTFHRRGEAAELPDFDDIVIKPTVGAGSYATERFRKGEGAAAQAHLDRLLAERDAMVQSYIASVDDYGERAVVWIDGAITHAVRKSPRFNAGHELVSEAVDVAADERAVAEAALAPLADRLLYGRIDLARGPDGAPLIMELEILEPSLFLLQHPPAAARLADGIVRRLAGGARDS